MSKFVIYIYMYILQAAIDKSFAQARPANYDAVIANIEKDVINAAAYAWAKLYAAPADQATFGAPSETFIAHF